MSFLKEADKIYFGNNLTIEKIYGTDIKGKSSCPGPGTK